MNGRQLAGVATERWPHLKVLFHHRLHGKCHRPPRRARPWRELHRQAILDRRIGREDKSIGF